MAEANRQEAIGERAALKGQQRPSKCQRRTWRYRSAWRLSSHVREAGWLSLLFLALMHGQRARMDGRGTLDADPRRWRTPYVHTYVRQWPTVIDNGRRPACAPLPSVLITYSARERRRDDWMADRLDGPSSVRRAAPQRGSVGKRGLRSWRAARGLRRGRPSVLFTADRCLSLSGQLS